MLLPDPSPGFPSTAPLGPKVRGFIVEVSFWRRGGAVCCDLSASRVFCWEKYDVCIDDSSFSL